MGWYTNIMNKTFLFSYSNKENINHIITFLIDWVQYIINITSFFLIPVLLMNYATILKFNSFQWTLIIIMCINLNIYLWFPTKDIFMKYYKKMVFKE